MKSKIPWLDMTPPAERQKNFERYQREMFPLGPRQRELELAALQRLVGGRYGQQELLFQLLQVKECLAGAEGEARQRALARWGVGQLARRFAPQERAVFIALAVLQEGSTDLASFPTDEEVQAEARRWLEDAAQKPPRRWPFIRK